MVNAFANPNCGGLANRGGCFLCKRAFDGGSLEFGEAVRRQLHEIRFRTHTTAAEWRGAVRIIELIWG